MAEQGQVTPLSSYQVAYATGAVKPQIQGAGPEAWFGPSQPLGPMAPPEVAGRQYDYPFGANLNYIPRSDSPVTFEMLRNLADNLPELRLVIEKRKDQIGGWQWDIQPILEGKDKRKTTATGGSSDARGKKVLDFLRKPDRRHSFHTWLRVLVEDMLVTDAACIYPRLTKGGELFSLDLVDGATIKQLIDDTGRAPLPPDPAYQQILHGIPAADFTLDELMYVPRNVRSNRLYGFSPVEQIILTINIALRKNIYNLEYFNSSTLPAGFGTLPKEWGPDQIKAYQDHFDSLLRGNLADRRKILFMPGDFRFTPVHQPPVKDWYDEWLMRIICAAFSIPPSSFVNDNNRATAQTLQIRSDQEGIHPLKHWVKNILDDVIQRLLGYDDLEFVWSGDDEMDPLEQAQAAQVLIACGVKSRDEVRVEYGLDPFGVGPTTDNPVIPLIEGYKQAVENINNPPPAPTLAAPGTPAQDGVPAKDDGVKETPAPAGNASKPPKTGPTPNGDTRNNFLNFAIDAEVAKDGAIPFTASGSATKYNDAEMRDERGRWTNGGGGNATYDSGAKQWTRADGSALPDHIAGLKIPPAWTGVQFAENPKSDLLVVGKDAKGRVQPIYSDAHWAAAAAEKYSRVSEMSAKFDSIMTQNAANYAKGDAATQAHADALETVAKMGIRPGSEVDTGAEKQAYGATTLQGQHVVTDAKGNTSLQFVGKKGVDLNLPVEDKALAAKLTARAQAAGPSGKLFPGVTDSSLRDYTHTLDGGGFKVKDFRTHLANATATAAVKATSMPTDQKSYLSAVKGVAKQVSAKLGNTPTVALQSYINPAVFAQWKMHAHV